MNFQAADAVVKAVLYEGYVLYPYRPSSIKNRQRWTFGGVYPRGCDQAGASRLESQCLVEGDAETRIEARVRFLQPLLRQIGELPTPVSVLPADAEPGFRPVESFTCNGSTQYTWEEAIERELRLPEATLRALADTHEPLRFTFAAERAIEPITGADALVYGCIVRSRAAIEGTVTVSANEVEAGAWRLVVRIDNTTPMPEGQAHAKDAASQRAFMSTHVILGVEGGAFVSLIDPPEPFAEAARHCTNQSAWPVLVGSEGSRDTLLCSPIILYDHPQIAPESPGDLFDGTEIAEILTLRILTMTDAEKAEMIANDDRARALLARTEALTSEQMQQLHGVMRNPRLPGEGEAALQRDRDGETAFQGNGDVAAPSRNAPPPRLATLNDGKNSLQVGARVRLNPKGGGDIFDIALAGEEAVIEAIEIDFDNRIHVAVTVASDPGQDLGMARMPGHRFFFSPEEVEIVSDSEANAP